MKLNDLKEGVITEDLEYSEEFAKMIVESEGDFTEIDGDSLDALLQEMLVEARAGNGQA